MLTLTCVVVQLEITWTNVDHDPVVVCSTSQLALRTWDVKQSNSVHIASLGDSDQYTKPEIFFKVWTVYKWYNFPYFDDWVHWRQSEPWKIRWVISTSVCFYAMMTSSNGNIYFRSYWPFVRGGGGGGIHRSPVFSLICAWRNGWANNRNASDFIRHGAHYDVTVIVPWIVLDITLFYTYAHTHIICPCNKIHHYILTHEITKFTTNHIHSIKTLWRNDAIWCHTSWSDVIHLAFDNGLGPVRYQTIT